MATAHDCRDCGERWEDNISHGECPVCGSISITSAYDEPYEDEEEDDEVADIRRAIYDDLKVEAF